MKRETLELAIFWFAIIGGFAVATAVTIWWSNGNKTLALWTGIFGVILWLLTFGLQIQKMIWNAISLQEASEPHTVPTPSPPQFRANVVTIVDSCVGAPMFVAVEAGIAGRRIVPIYRAMYLNITNLQPVKLTIESYIIEVGTRVDGPWTKAVPVRWDDAIFVVIEGIKAARALLMEEADLNRRLRRPIESHDTASGWVVFAPPRDGNFVRLTLYDTAGNRTVSIASPAERREGVDLRDAPLPVAQTPIDLSGLPITEPDDLAGQH